MRLRDESGIPFPEYIFTKDDGTPIHPDTFSKHLKALFADGIVNYVMGLCFVTEGAIPYAAADPLRVLPSCVAGAALAGALSMTFGCALRAPHGGIFVFPVVDHALLYCMALAAGSVVGAVILSLLKKDRTDAV